MDVTHLRRGKTWITLRLQGRTPARAGFEHLERQAVGIAVVLLIMALRAIGQRGAAVMLSTPQPAASASRTSYSPSRGGRGRP